MSTIETTLPNLKINILTKEQFTEATNNFEINNNELYFVSEEIPHSELSGRNEPLQHSASAIVFADGESLQEKFDSGSLASSGISIENE